MVNFAERRKEAKRTLNFRGGALPRGEKMNFRTDWLTLFGVLILLASQFFNASIIF